MSQYLLDTSIYCQPIKPKPLLSVMNRWKKIGDKKIAISVITHSEIIFGLSLKGSDKLTQAFNYILKNRFPVLPITQEIAEDFGYMKAEQQKKGRKGADLDLLIAATARVHRLIVVSLNAKDFNRIDGILVEDWSQSL